MELIFPALKTNYLDKVYYVSSLKLGLAYKLFIGTLTDLDNISDSEISELKKHILDNKEKPIIANFTVFFDSKYTFSEFSETPNYGNLNLSLIENNFFMYESQNVKISLGKALAEEKTLKEQNIIVTFFPVEELKDLDNLILKLDIGKNIEKSNDNNNSKKKDYHDNSFYEVTEYLFENFKLLKSLVDFENNSLSLRAKNLFTINAILEANENLLLGLSLKEEENKKIALEFWSYLFEVFSEWDRCKPSEIREKFIHSSLIVLSAIASFSGLVIFKHKDTWKNYLYGINKINWSKENIEWVNIGVLKNIGGAVISSTDAKNNLVDYLKKKLNFESEEDSPQDIYSLLEKEYSKVIPYISFNKRKDGNVSIKGNNYIFCYLDFIDDGRMLIGRLKISPSHPDLKNYVGLWRKSTIQHEVGNWGNRVIDLPIVSSIRIKEYIELMEITRKSSTF